VVPLQVKTAFEILMGIGHRSHIRVLSEGQTGNERNVETSHE
jgi:hypothetical protein